MNSADLLVDGFGRIRGVVHEAVDGLTPDQLSARPGGDTNSIAWLVWHLTRVEDDHLADAAGTEQVWTARGWEQKFGLPFDAAATGYGHTAAEVAAVQVSSANLLADYHDAVHDQAVRYISGLSDGDLDRIVDENWDPPVTLAVRLVSVLSDCLQHGGQAAYARGLLT